VQQRLALSDDDADLAIAIGASVTLADHLDARLAEREAPAPVPRPTADRSGTSWRLLSVVDDPNVYAWTGRSRTFPNAPGRSSQSGNHGGAFPVTQREGGGNEGDQHRQLASSSSSPRAYGLRRRPTRSGVSWCPISFQSTAAPPHVPR
jgi:hypothetical protein